MIVLSAAIAAIGAGVAIVWPDLATVPANGGVVPLLLPRLPALALTSIAVYALVAVVATAGGLIAATVGLRRWLGRSETNGQTGALDWIAAFDATALRALMPRPVGALPNSPGRGATILLSNRFDPRLARAEAAHVTYIWLARTHALGALAGLAALAALGFAQQQGGALFLPGRIPTGSTVLVLVGLLMLVLLARFAFDVTLDPLIEALARLPWEQADAGRLRYAVELLESERIGATLGGSGAEIANEVPERFAIALENGNRALAVIGERLSNAAEMLGAATRSSSDALDRMLREIRSIAGRGGDPGGAAMQAAVEALTAELRRDAAVGPGLGTVDEDRRALAEAVERLSEAADAVGAAARSASDAVAVALRETAARTAIGPDAGGAGSSEALLAGVAALTAQVQRLTALFDAAREAPPIADAAAGRAAANFGRELKKLLAEI